jgi:predicted SAM-dependent methyltransferase
MKLNLGCGTNKIDGFINVDIDGTLEPDQVWDFRKTFPIKTCSVDEIVMYHIIEHIEKKYHFDILTEIQRVLKPEGTVTFSFPEFLKVVENWKENKRGLRDFWEATIFGRQASKFDYHVCIMDSEQFSVHLVRHGFEILVSKPEPGQEFNSFIKAKKVPYSTFESVIQDCVFGERATQ